MIRRWLPWGIILVAAGLLTMALREVIAASIILPLLYLLWIGTLIFLSIPQGFIWGAFLGVALLIAWRSLVRWPRRSRPSYPAAAPPAGRLESWLRLIRQARQEPYYRWQLAQNLRRLMLAALAHEEQLTLKQARRRLAHDRLALPPDIQAYLQASARSFGEFAGRPGRLPWRKAPPASPLDLDPARIAQFLEEKLNR